jgi:hypothetical protein
MEVLLWAHVPSQFGVSAQIVSAPVKSSSVIGGIIFSAIASHRPQRVSRGDPRGYGLGFRRPELQDEQITEETGESSGAARNQCHKGRDNRSRKTQAGQPGTSRQTPQQAHYHPRREARRRGADNRGLNRRQRRERKRRNFTRLKEKARFLGRAFVGGLEIEGYLPGFRLVPPVIVEGALTKKWS